MKKNWPVKGKKLPISKLIKIVILILVLISVSGSVLHYFNLLPFTKKVIILKAT